MSGGKWKKKITSKLFRIVTKLAQRKPSRLQRAEDTIAVGSPTLQLKVPASVCQDTSRALIGRVKHSRLYLVSGTGTLLISVVVAL